LRREIIAHAPAPANISSIYADQWRLSILLYKTCLSPQSLIWGQLIIHSPTRDGNCERMVCFPHERAHTHLTFQSTHKLKREYFLSRCNSAHKSLNAWLHLSKFHTISTNEVSIFIEESTFYHVTQEDRTAIYSPCILDRATVKKQERAIADNVKKTSCARS
jgi:hypothetical protein